VAFPSLGHRLRIPPYFCSPALEDQTPTVDRGGSAVDEILNSFGQPGIRRLGGGVVCGDELVVVVSKDGAHELAGVMGGAALHRVQVVRLFASVFVLAGSFVEIGGIAVAASRSELTRRSAKVLHEASLQRITVVLGALQNQGDQRPSEARSRPGSTTLWSAYRASDSLYPTRFFGGW
jgi:hypothetical protein